MARKTTVFSGWMSYCDKVVSHVMSNTQAEECHRAFYAGAHSALCMMQQTASAAKNGNVDVTLRSLLSEVDVIVNALELNKPVT